MIEKVFSYHNNYEKLKNTKVFIILLYTSMYTCKIFNFANLIHILRLYSLFKIFVKEQLIFTSENAIEVQNKLHGT